MNWWWSVGSRPTQKEDEHDGSSRENSKLRKGRTHGSHTRGNEQFNI